MRKMLVAGALFSLLSLPTLSSAQQQDTFDYKGKSLGSDLTSFQSDPKYSCWDPKKPLVADMVCKPAAGETETIAGAPAKSVLFVFYAGKLSAISVHIEEKYFTQVIEALKEKYGKGEYESEMIQNRMGAKFENKNYVWLKAGGMLNATRYSGNLETSAVLYRTGKSVEEYINRRTTTAKDRAKDL